MLRSVSFDFIIAYSTPNYMKLVRCMNKINFQPGYSFTASYIEILVKVSLCMPTPFLSPVLIFKQL